MEIVGIERVGSLLNMQSWLCWPSVCFGFYVILDKHNTSDLLACLHWTMTVHQEECYGGWGPASTSDEAKVMLVSEQGKRCRVTPQCPEWMRTVSTRRWDFSLCSAETGIRTRHMCRWRFWQSKGLCRWHRRGHMTCGSCRHIRNFDTCPYVLLCWSSSPTEFCLDQERS